jgi:hypothetical protein
MSNLILTLALVMTAQVSPNPRPGAHWGMLGAPTVAARDKMYDDSFSSSYAASIGWPHTIGGKTYDRLNREDQATLMNLWVKWMEDRGGNPPMPGAVMIRPITPDARAAAKQARADAKVRTDVPLVGIGINGERPPQRMITRRPTQYRWWRKQRMPLVRENRQPGGKTQTMK